MEFVIKITIILSVIFLIQNEIYYKSFFFLKMYKENCLMFDLSK